MNERIKYTVNPLSYKGIPSNPIAYWISNAIVKSFSEKRLGDYVTTREGMATADNDTFLRYWYEVKQNAINFDCQIENDSITRKVKWVPYNKGGEYRKWYGNNDYVVNWENNGFAIRNNIDTKTGRIRSHNYNGDFGFKLGMTWSAISSNISIRYCPMGFLFDSKGAKGFSKNDKNIKYFIALVNSIVGSTYLSFFSPTMDFKVGDVIQIPVFETTIENPEIDSISYNSIVISKSDWDSFETSWDFKKHPLI